MGGGGGRIEMCALLTRKVVARVIVCELGVRGYFGCAPRGSQAVGGVPVGDLFS